MILPKILLKTEYMDKGRYSVKDIPLNNGINKILIELVNELGTTKTFIFNEQVCSCFRL